MSNVATVSTGTLTNIKARQKKSGQSFLSKQKDRIRSYFAKTNSSFSEKDAPEDWVPADRRVGGFDKNTIWPGVVVLIIWAIWAHGMPLINSQIEYDRPIKEGDVINLGNEELTFVPAVGWNLEEGSLISDENVSGVPITKGGAILSKDGVTFEVRTAAFSGTPDELLDQILNISDALEEVYLKDVGDRVSFKNVDGVPAVIVPYTAYEEQGGFATYVFEADPQDVGVEVIISVSEDADIALAKDVAQMLANIAYKPARSMEAAQ